MMHRFQPGQSSAGIHNPIRRRSGFTLIELMIVIGIIVALIGILIPLVGKIRISVQTVNTKQMLSRLEAGIENYQSVFSAAPGVFSNSQLLPFTGGPTTAINGQALTDVTAGTTITNVTSSENLYLSLAGGLAITVNATPAVTAFNYQDSLGQNMSGPGNLNPANQKRYGTYMTFTAEETSYPKEANLAQPTNPQGQWNMAMSPLVGDTQIPEFLDKFARPSPILYIRANRGAVGVTIGSVTSQIEAAQGSPAYNGGYQYQFDQVVKTYQAAAQGMTTSWPDTQMYPAQTNSSGNTVLSAGAESYAGNPATSTAASASAHNAIAFQKDGYILISAGPDGIYGTSDDIINFR